MERAPCPNCNELLPPGTFCPKDGAKVPAIMDFNKGARVGKYILEEKVGEGGMGEVWRGKNPELNKRVAIKILNPQLLANNQAIARFKREALAVNEIRHKNLVDIFDIGELADGRPYFVMEYLEGEPLDEYLKRVGPLPFSEILTMMGPICRALYATHQRNIIHRDMKPENIFLVKEEEGPPTIKLLDFGIAKLSTSDETKNNVTRTGSVIGTPAYMSPEQCEGAKAVDHRSDIYALGIILFEMITGRTPFQEPGEGTGMVLAKHITMPAPDASRTVIGRRLPIEVDVLLQRALSKNPNERPQSAQDFYNDLVKATSGQKDETSEHIKGAKPLYEQNPQLPPPPNHTPVPPTIPSIALPNEESPSNTGDFYAGDSGSTHALAKKSGRKMIWFGAAFSLVAGAAFTYLLLSQQQPVESSKATNAAQLPSLPTVTNQDQSKPAQPQETSKALEPASTPGQAPSKPESVLLVLTSEVASAKIFLGDKLLGTVPIEHQIPYQTEDVKLRVEAEGYEPKEMNVRPDKNLVLIVAKKDLVKKPSANANVNKPKKPKQCFNADGLAIRCPD